MSDWKWIQLTSNSDATKYNKLNASQDKVAVYHELKRDEAPGETNINKNFDIKAAQSEFKETTADTLHRQLKDIVAMVQQQA